MVDPLDHRRFNATLLKAPFKVNRMPKGDRAYQSFGGYLFENLSRFFAFLVLSILVAIIVALIDNFGKALFPDFAYFTLFAPMGIMLAVRPKGLFGKVS